jgi:hypothetical protein
LLPFVRPMSLTFGGSHHDSDVAFDPDVTFDDVKRLPTSSPNGGLGFRAVGTENLTADTVQRAPATVGVPASAATPAATAQPAVPSRTSLSVGAGRLPEARGAWLTGTIEAIAETSPSNQRPRAFANAVSHHSIAIGQQAGQHQRPTAARQPSPSTEAPRHAATPQNDDTVWQ